MKLGGTHMLKLVREQVKPELNWDTDFVKFTKSGCIPKLSISNLKVLLDYYEIELTYNEMTHEIEIDGKPIENRHDVIVKDLATKHDFIGATINTISQYMNAVAYENKYHPVKNYLDHLKPVTGMQEIRKLIKTLKLSNGDDSEYAEMLIVKWLVSCVAAIYEDDFRSQGALTLQGKGGIMKSSWFRKIIPKKHWFRGEFVGLDVGNRDSVQKAIKYWICELAELESTLKKDFVSLKGFITSEYDEYRAAYERRFEKHPRRTVFCSTVNSVEFIKDDTGDRRFWVLEIDEIDMDTEIDTEKLWAEVLSLYRSGETYWPDREQTEAIMEQNRNYSIKSNLDDYLDSIIDPSRPPEEYTVQKVTEIVLMDANIHDVTTSKVGKALNKRGLRSKVKKIYGKPCRVYKLYINRRVI
jgi:putative DNA primase/helicase